MPRQRLRGLLLVAFGLIATTVAVSDFVGTWRTRRARAEVKPALANAFTSVEQLSRISRAFTRERLLVDTHIAEKEKLGMQRVFAHIADVDHELADAEAAYAQLTVFDHEAEIWAGVRADLDALRPDISEVLALSSQNRDSDAQQRLVPLDARFARVNGEMARLIDINRRGGLQAFEHADAVERSADLVSTLLALLAIALTIAVGVVTTRLVARREHQIVEYAVRLEDQNRELDAFAGRVAHDLRGPLTAVNMGASRLIAERTDGVGALIRKSVDRMERLIRDLLALSQVESQSRGASCDPAVVAAAVREELASRTGETEGTVRVEVAPAKVQARDGLLIEALINLAENAIKYRRPEVPPVVDITGQVVGGAYELAVADNGMGMSPDEMRQAFEPFYRARREPSRPGTGLGLSIVKRVAEASGGSVRVHSTVGQGSTFVLRLPLAA